MKLRIKKIDWTKRNKAVAALITALAAISIYVTAAHFIHKDYYYIDLNGNKGVAKKCWEQECGLFCDRLPNGIVQVQQYWHVD